MGNINYQPQSGNIVTKSGEVKNIVTLFGGGTSLGDTHYDIDSYSPRSGMVIGEDGLAYDLADLIQGSKGQADGTPFERGMAKYSVEWKNPDDYEDFGVAYLAFVMRNNGIGLFVISDEMFDEMTADYEKGILVDVTGTVFTAFGLVFPAHELKHVSLLYLEVEGKQFGIFHDRTGSTGMTKEDESAYVDESWIVSESTVSVMLEVLAQLD